MVSSYTSSALHDNNFFQSSTCVLKFFVNKKFERIISSLILNIKIKLRH